MRYTGAQWLVRVVRTRPRLFGSAAVGIVATAALAALTGWRPVTRLLVGWDVGVTLYLILVLHVMTGARVHHIRRDAQLQDEGRLTISVLTVTQPESGGGGRRRHDESHRELEAVDGRTT